MYNLQVLKPLKMLSEKASPSEYKTTKYLKMFIKQTSTKMQCITIA